MARQVKRSAKGKGGAAKGSAPRRRSGSTTRTAPVRRQVRRKPKKGQHAPAAGRILLRAVAQLPGVWRLQIAGSGPEQRALAQLAKELGIADRVQFDGVIPSAQMPAYLQQLDVLALPSRTLPNWKEQFGRVLIEAMACEVAVVGSDSGEIPNVIGEAGLIFPEDDVHTLRTHLQHLMAHAELRDELGRAGRQRVLAHYTQAKIAAQTVEVYREMAAGKATGSLAHNARATEAETG